MFKNIIKKKVKSYCIENDIENEDLGFQSFINELFYKGNQNEISDGIIDECIVDGQSDKQIDLIQIEEDDITTIRILQVKNKNGFESNTVILLRNGLSWMFNKEEEMVLTLSNISFKNRILEVRDILDRVKQKNIYIDVCYVTLGDINDIRESDEITAEIEALKSEYKNIFKNFRFQLYGAKELVEYIDLINEKTVDADLEIIYDVHIPSIIENKNNNIRSLVCNIKASELVKIFEVQQNEYLFEQNVRKYLDDRSKVNKNIIDTAGSDDSEYFWALNNGVTFICNKYDVKKIGGKATLEMEKLQIINGCQTTMALFEASKNGDLKDNTSLLLRIHETADEKVIEKIIIATNNQNPISPKDLVSNSTEQIELQKYFFEIYNVAYQRKRNDMRDLSGKLINKKDIVPNDKVGQASLACIKRMPNIALGSKGRVFSSDSDIFEKNKENIALSLFIHEKVLEYSKSNDMKKNYDMSSILKFGRFHITSLLYRKYCKDSSIELNKKIKYNDINLSPDIFLATYILKENLLAEQKLNLLSYFKSRDSVNKVDEIYESISSINKTVELINDKFNINIDIKELCDNDMIIEIEMIEIKIRLDGKINIYKKFSYEDIEEYQYGNEATRKERDMLMNKLEELYSKKPECIDDSYGIDEVVGYFGIDTDGVDLNKFVEVAI